LAQYYAGLCRRFILTSALANIAAELETVSKRIVARNRKAARDFMLEDRFEAGIALLGSEIKAVRAGQVSLNEAHVGIERGEAWLLNAHIAAYEPASQRNHELRRPRKLLLHRRELDQISSKVKQRGYTLIPVQMYLTHGLAKVEIALAKGKRQYDKRREIAEREAQREMQRALRRKN
jgi:SsrA-binding protein